MPRPVDLWAAIGASMGRVEFETLEEGRDGQVVDRLLKGTPFESLLPTKDVAYVGIALYMGLETLTHLDGDRARVAELFATAKSLAPFVDMIRTGGGTGA